MKYEEIKMSQSLFVWTFLSEKQKQNETNTIFNSLNPYLCGHSFRSLKNFVIYLKLKTSQSLFVWTFLSEKQKQNETNTIFNSLNPYLCGHSLRSEEFVQLASEMQESQSLFVWTFLSRSEERRVGKECRYRWALAELEENKTRMRELW